MIRFLSLFLFYFLILTTLSLACSKKSNTPVSSAPKIEEEPLDINKLIIEKSYLTINYGLNKQGIVDTFSFLIDDSFKDAMVFPQYDAKAEIKRSSEINVEFEGRKVLIDLPLEILITKSTFLGDVKADGELKISIISELIINNFWEFSTSSNVATYSWTRKPKLKIGVSLPIESLANSIVEKLKPEIEHGIDENLKSSIDLKSKIQKMANQTLQPYRLNEVYGGWMTTVIDTAFMSGAFNSKDRTEGKIQLAARTFVSSKKPDIAPISKTPIFAWKSFINDTSTINFQLDISYTFLESIANKNLQGKIFSEGDKKITISDVTITGSDGKLVVNAKVYGSFNGSLLIKGKPIYDKEKKLLKATNIDVSINTGNVLHSAAAWLLKGKIKDELSKLLEFPLEDKVLDIQYQLDDFLNNHQSEYKAEITAKIENIDIRDINVEERRIRSIVTVKSILHTYLKDLSLFR